MNTFLVYFLTFIGSILLYLAAYCLPNRYNCVRNKGLNLPFGFDNFIGPFKHLFKGRPTVFFSMIFSLNTPYLFIILGMIGMFIYRNFYSDSNLYTSTSNDNDDDNEDLDAINNNIDEDLDADIVDDENDEDDLNNNQKEDELNIVDDYNTSY